MRSIAIIGTGPTAIYTLHYLTRAERPLVITLFEAQPVAGWGMPYDPRLNDKAMLSNIASLEIPVIMETLVDWLARQSDDELVRLNVVRSSINEREFFPRLVLGEFFQAQFNAVLERARASGHTVTVKTNSRVVDIALQADDIRLTVEAADGQSESHAFGHVVMATGHSWPDQTETKPGYFTSPWPSTALRAIGNCAVGIRGTSLSAIDATVTIASSHGSFLLDAGGVLQYQPQSGRDDFKLTLMSRKGLLPEADFYHPIPYLPLSICTAEAVKALIAMGSRGLLDKVFELFRQELDACDPAYSARIGLANLTVDTFGAAYFAERDGEDAFVWAARNLAEAKNNLANRTTVRWRYAILRMHEVIAPIVPELDAEDLERFHKAFKQIFSDDYATVPHASIERLLALRRIGKIDIVKLGDSYEIDTDSVATGAVLRLGSEERHFPAFVEATGQKALSAPDVPFPTLIAQGIVKEAVTHKSQLIATDEPSLSSAAGGLDLDTAYRPRSVGALHKELYCLSLPFLLHQFPFIQGITSSDELGRTVAKAILAGEVEGAGVTDSRFILELA